MPAKVPFRVIHVSGQDENFRAAELNSHSPTTKGWQSSRFCLYPQDIVVQLDNRSRLRKIQILSHQFLIATKIEFYVGDVPDGIPVSLQNARYTRLGYVALSDNEKTGYKARELKSVHVDANGVFVKFVIHKNHINKHNLFNQVGIVALNVIGDEVDKDKFIDRSFADDLGEIDDLALKNANRPDYISPLDDLAFDMYQDPEVAQIIRRLEHKKQEAVLQERYDYAKKLKTAIQDLQKVGEKLGKYEVEKRQAVENEDYDKAKLKKVQMDEYRLQVYKQLELYELLEMSGPLHPKHVDLAPTREATPPRLTQITPGPETGRLSTPPPRTPYDDRPLPAIKQKNNGPTEEEDQPLPSQTPIQDRPLPAKRTKNPDLDDDEVNEATPAQTGNVTGEPEQMNDKDQREAGIVIDTFGMPLVSKAYSKTWSYREDALLEVYKDMQEMSTAEPKEEAKTKVRAALFLIVKALKDKVQAVYTAGLNLLKMILTEFSPDHKIGKADVSYVVEKCLPPLIQRTGDTAPRSRDAAKNFIIECSKFPEVKPLHTVPHECVKPFKLSISPRWSLSRTELVDMLYKEHGLNNSGLSVENIMKFCCKAIQHTAGEVREKAEQIIIDLYKEVREPVKSHLPPDDERTRKNVLYKQLFQAFDRIDGKPSKDDLKKQKADTEVAKQKEIEALQNQLQQLKDMAAGKAPVDEKAIKDEKKEKTKKITKAKPKPDGKSESKPQGTADDAADDASTFQIDRACTNAILSKKRTFLARNKGKPEPSKMAKPQLPKAAKTRPQPAKTAKTKPEASKTVGTRPQKPKTQKANIPPKLTPKSVTKGVAVERPKSSMGSPPVREVHLSAASSEESSSVVADSTSEGVACGEDTLSDQGQNGTASNPSEGVMCDTDTLSDTGQSGTASIDGAVTRVVTPNTACTISTGSCVTLACTCIFCGEKNEAFTDEGLDLHYWKSCPMLKRCSQCKQVVEIAGLTDHLLDECDQKNTFKKCLRCTEAITDTEYDQHTADKSCPPAETNKGHCPMCHLNIPAGEDAWKDHLMGERGCKGNPRRLPALNKQAKGAIKPRGLKPPSKVNTGKTPRK